MPLRRNSLQYPSYSAKNKQTSDSGDKGRCLTYTTAILGFLLLVALVALIVVAVLYQQKTDNSGKYSLKIPVKRDINMLMASREGRNQGLSPYLIVC